VKAVTLLAMFASWAVAREKAHDSIPVGTDRGAVASARHGAGFAPFADCARMPRRRHSGGLSMEITMHSFKSFAGLALLAAAAATQLTACGKVDPQLTADQMTMSDATCAPAEIDRIADADVRKAFGERCARRSQLPRPADQPAPQAH
jgi:entry exclusion lipoprotein TrbK